MVGLPTRTKTASSECSLSSVQVTAQTYAYLQSQLVMMKWLLGRNIFKSGKERLGEAKVCTFLLGGKASSKTM